jgi:hypothetical protein
MRKARVLWCYTSNLRLKFIVHSTNMIKPLILQCAIANCDERGNDKCLSHRCYPAYKEKLLMNDETESPAFTHDT